MAPLSLAAYSLYLIRLKGNKMLSIEYTHKRSRLFRIELSLIVVATFIVLIFVWQILSLLKFFK